MEEDDSEILFVHGGHLKDYPEPRIRQFPNDTTKRTVTATITTWIGQGDCSAKHYNVTFIEEHNHFKSGNNWIKCWDEPNNGWMYEIKVTDPADVLNRINEVFNEHFSSETHELIIAGQECLDIIREQAE
jgi:hypothetical protein